LSAKVSSRDFSRTNCHFHISNPNLMREGRSSTKFVKINLNKMPVSFKKCLVLGFHDDANLGCELFVLMRSEAFANIMYVTIPE
jgi:hypothetical protein